MRRWEWKYIKKDVFLFIYSFATFNLHALSSCKPNFVTTAKKANKEMKWKVILKGKCKFVYRWNKIKHYWNGNGTTTEDTRQGRFPLTIHSLAATVTFQLPVFSEVLYIHFNRYFVHNNYFFHIILKNSFLKNNFKH